MAYYYSANRNVQLLVALLKAHGIRKVVASPGTANMELMLDTSIARAGIVPAFNIDRCLTKRAELLVSPERLEAMQVTRSLMRDTPPAKALPQLISMLETTDSNETFLSRVKDWAALIKKGAR